MKSLASHSPEVALEWDHVANGVLSPSSVSYGSNTKVAWVCRHDSRHKWIAAIGKRTAGQGCPICRNLLIIPGLNDLATSNHDLAMQLDRDSELYVDPTTVAAGSDRKVGWKCNLGHKWEASVKNRSGGQGCPICANKRLLPGFNDFATRFPELVAELHPYKNPGFSASDVFPSARIKLWWVCAAGHEYQTTVFVRAISGSGCPGCWVERSSRNRRGLKATFVPGKHDLATRYPSIAKEWIPERNTNRTPDEVRVSDKDSTTWWACPAGHEYQTSVFNRVSGTGCTVCSGKKVVAGINDLESQSPTVAKQFSVSLNGGQIPSEVLATSFKKYWWICELGHEWQARAYLRSRGLGCPFCANYSVLAGFNDFESRQPSISLEWDSERNPGRLPSEIYFGSVSKYWWKCNKGHSFSASPQSRSRGVGCPVCANREVLPGFNDLATRYPALAEEWDSNANGSASLGKLSAINNKRYHWKCEAGHFWEASLANRIYGAGCPSCASFGFDPNKPAYFYLIEHGELLARKVGIANQGTNRLEIWQRFGWSVLVQTTGQGRQMLDLETLVIRWLRDDLRLPQHLSQSEMRGHKGATETFGQESVSAGEVLAKIDEFLGLVMAEDFKIKRRSRATKRKS